MLLIASRTNRGSINLLLDDERILWLCEDGQLEELLLPEPLLSTVLCRIRAEGVFVFDLLDLLQVGYESKPVAFLQFA